MRKPTDVLEIRMNNISVNDQTIEIYSMLGIKVFNTPLASPLFRGENLKIDVSALSQGVYFLIVGAGSQPVQRAKFVKM